MTEADTTYGRAAQFERERGRRAYESALEDAVAEAAPFANTDATGAYGGDA